VPVRRLGIAEEASDGPRPGQFFPLQGAGKADIGTETGLAFDARLAVDLGPVGSCAKGDGRYRAVGHAFAAARAQVLVNPHEKNTLTQQLIQPKVQFFGLVNSLRTYQRTAGASSL
jgi:hypothetical protein